MNFLDIVKYDYEEKLYGDRPNYTFERMILRQLETIIRCEDIIVYLITNDFEGFKKELSKYGDVEMFFKELSDIEHRNSNVASIQLKMFEYFKNYINTKDLSPEDIVIKSNSFSNWIVDSKTICYFDKVKEEIDGIEKLDRIKPELEKIVKSEILKQNNQPKRK